MFSTSASLVFHANFTISELKNRHSRSPQLCLKILYIPPSDSGYKFHKTGIEHWLQIVLFRCGKLETSKSIMGTKFRRSHVCLQFQAGNRLYQLVFFHLLSILIHFENCNEMALLFSSMLQ